MGFLPVWSVCRALSNSDLLGVQIYLIWLLTWIRRTSFLSSSACQLLQVLGSLEWGQFCTAKRNEIICIFIWRLLCYYITLQVYSCSDIVFLVFYFKMRINTSSVTQYQTNSFFKWFLTNLGWIHVAIFLWVISCDIAYLFLFYYYYFFICSDVF